jgi:hypothetical protein
MRSETNAAFYLLDLQVVTTDIDGQIDALPQSACRLFDKAHLATSDCIIF